MQGRPKEYDNLPEQMEFEEAKSNFVRAARYGNETCLNWMGKSIPASELILKELLPLAAAGLQKMGLAQNNIDKYLGIIRDRCQKQTGSQWMIKNFRHLKKKHKTDDAIVALTQAIYENQQDETPVHQWPETHQFEAFETKAGKVGHIMTTTLVTGDSLDSAKLTLEFMHWNRIHHLPIVDNRERLVGIITYSHLRQFWDKIHDTSSELLAKDIMVNEVIVAIPSTPITEAIELMKEKEIGCLPVVQNGYLVGIITTKDLENIKSV
jgi:CBS domain-containing protein